MCWADTDLGHGVVHHHVGRTGDHREGLVVVRIVMVLVVAVAVVMIVFPGCRIGGCAYACYNALKNTQGV